MLSHLDFSRPRSVLAWAVGVGILAGLAAATFHAIVSEPLIDRAIALEESGVLDDTGHPTEEDHADDSVEVSRSTQRGVGLFSAYGLLGAAYALGLSVVALSLRGSWLDPFRRVAVAGTILAGALTVVPWFKYPPNPPGVGDPATAGERQRLYWLLVALTAVVLAGAVHLSGRLRTAGWPQARRVALTTAAAAVVLGLVVAIMPAITDPIPAAVPANLLWRFRTASLGGNLLLWGLLTVGFGALCAEAAARRASSTVAAAGAAAADQNSMPFRAEMPLS